MSILSSDNSIELSGIIEQQCGKNSITANEMYSATYGNLPSCLKESTVYRVSLKLNSEYKEIKDKTVEAVGGNKALLKKGKFDCLARTNQILQIIIFIICCIINKPN